MSFRFGSTSGNYISEYIVYKGDVGDTLSLLSRGSLLYDHLFSSQGMGPVQR